MNTHEKAASHPPGQDSGISNKASLNHSKSRRHRKGKQYRILKLLSQGHSMNRFEALSAGDSALNSTVATIEARYGIQVARKWEKIPGRFGKIRLCRYWLEPGENLQKARELIANWG